MRTIFILCGLMLAAGVVFAVRSLRGPTEFGTFVGAPRVEVAELIERPKDFLGKNVSVEGVVREQCKAMGCVFSMPAGTKTLRIDLQEVAMKAPMREGRRARVEGQIVPYGDGYQLYASAVRFE